MPKEVVKKDKVYFVYILKCADETLYTGSTSDIEKRVIVHNTGKAAAKYTRVRRPVVLMYSESFVSKNDALKRECQIKKMSRLEKLKLIGYLPRQSKKMGI